MPLDLVTHQSININSPTEELPPHPVILLLANKVANKWLNMETDDKGETSSPPLHIANKIAKKWINMDTNDERLPLQWDSGIADKVAHRWMNINTDDEEQLLLTVDRVTNKWFKMLTNNESNQTSPIQQSSTFGIPGSTVPLVTDKIADKWMNMDINDDESVSADMIRSSKSVSANLSLLSHY